MSFLSGGGASAQSIRERDWSDHPLGPPEDWSPELKAALSLVLNSPESMILAWGADLTFFFNDTYAPLLGPRVAWAMGERFDRVWADAWDQAKPIIANALAGRSRRFEDLPWTLDTDRGEANAWFSFSYSRVLNRDGKVAGLFVFTNETTHRVLSDAALQESQRNLEGSLADVRCLNATLEQRFEERTTERDLMWDTAPDLMLIIDFDGIFRRVNPAWTRLLGYGPEELIDHHVNEFVLPDDHDETVEAYTDAAEGGSPRLCNRYRHKDGSTRWISWTAAPAGVLTYATGRDITAERRHRVELEQAQEALRQSQKLEAIGQLTGGVAHDFNNLLTVIKSSTDLLKRPDLREDRRSRYVAAISDTVDRAAKLTAQLLAFARRQSLRPEVFAAGDSVRALSEMLGTLTGSQIEVDVELPRDAYFVHADANQFDTALVNLVVNARDAMGGQGRLSIVVEAVEGMPPVRAHPAVAGPFVAISVTDTGSGIQPDDMEKIFEPFFTTKGVGQGTGLGLSQVFGFAKQSGGEIVVRSEVGVGSTFTLYLPRVAPADRTRHDVEPETLVDGHGTRVLVVEDNAEVGAFAVQTLKDLGYAPVLANDAEGALAELTKGTDRFYVVFSDVVMPGMNGIDLATEIRRRHPRMPVLLVSGYSHVLAQDGTRGFDLLHKPYSVADLSRQLRKVVGSRPRTSGPGMAPRP
ncbi:hybrid sensor histidine kinase/response regulator [Lichenibacterium minor]|nr:PAS domain-containing sensor histidine kinase [Lichenibacterium minor]